MNGHLICITGIDGAGKSTQAKRLVARLRREGYRARYVWGGRQAILTAPFVGGGKRLLHAPKRPHDIAPTENRAYREYVTHARRALKQPALRAAWRTLTIGEHMLQLLLHVELPLLRGEVVVCDRYLYDSLVNQVVLLGRSPWQLARTLRRPLWKLAPEPALGFWLDLEPAIAATRKTDIYDLEQLSTRVPLYAALADTLGFTRLDATYNADELAATIWETTERTLLRRKTLSNQFVV